MPMLRKAYPSDLNDSEWDHIKDLLPAASKIGSPRTVDLREIINAIFYIANNGIKWRAMPHDFPPWSTVYTYFRRWTRNGLWAKINSTLVAKVRVNSGRQAQPSLIIIDSQSVKMAQKGGLNRVLTATSESKVASVIS
jgi:transposase